MARRISSSRYSKKKDQIFKVLRSNVRLKTMRQGTQNNSEVKYGNASITIGLQDRQRPKQASKPIVNLPSERKIRFHYHTDEAVPATIPDAMTRQKKRMTRLWRGRKTRPTGRDQLLLKKFKPSKKARSCKSTVAQKNQMQVIKETAASGPSRKL